MKLIESASGKTINPATLQATRGLTFKMDSGHTAQFIEGYGWSYAKASTGRNLGLLNPARHAKKIAEIQEAIKRGI